MPEKLCKRYLVKGLVQGVWFRASTQEEAKKLNITGWARNLPDGGVEVIACGTEEQLLQLHTWLQQGPPLAKVEEVKSEDLPFKEYDRCGVL